MIQMMKPADRTSPVKLYAEVPSTSRPSVKHKVTYIRKPGMERWTCTCEDQNIIKIAKRRHCRHIKEVREQIAAESGPVRHK